mgnify:CR=1 FL=1
MQQKNHNKLFFKVNLSDDLVITQEKNIVGVNAHSVQNSSYNNSFIKKISDDNGSRIIEYNNPPYQMEEIKEQSDNESQNANKEESKSSKLANANSISKILSQRIGLK